MSQHHNINGAAESNAVTQWDVLDVSSGNFEPKKDDEKKSPHPFYLNNLTDEAIILEVTPYHAEKGVFIATTFRPDWNPMQVKCVKQNANVAGKFLWGR